MAPHLTPAELDCIQLPTDCGFPSVVLFHRQYTSSVPACAQLFRDTEKHKIIANCLVTFVRATEKHKTLAIFV